MAIFEQQNETIYVDLDDEVTTIFARIRVTRAKNIFLVVPTRAQILQSLVSLKILRFKSEHAGKVLTIVTKDSAGRRLAEESGIAVLENLRSKNSPKKKPDATSRNSVPPKITRKKFAIVQLASKVFPKLQKISRDDIPLANLNFSRGAKRIWSRVAGVASVEEVSGDGESAFVVRPPSRRVLFVLLASATALLFFIVYIAVPTATIYVTPRADTLSKVVNVTLSDQINSGVELSNTHSISAEFIDLDFSREIRIGATGRIFEGTNARGEVTIFNRSPKEKFIVPSRFATPDGLIFHSEKALTIPPARGDTLGSVTTTLIACEMDDLSCDCINEPEECEGEFIGDRGNIGPSFFVLPAIPSLSPALFWAESATDFTGGTTEITKYISAEDLENVEATVTHEIIALVREELTQLLVEKNELENQSLTLLDFASTAIKIEIRSIAVPPDLLEKWQDDFTVVVEAHIRAVAYESDDLRALLFEQIETKVHPDKTLVKINFDNATLRIEEINFVERHAKLAVTIEGVEEYDLSDDSEAGIRLTQKIRSRISGRSVDEVESYIRNLPEVSNAVISSWPFWARTIPELSENVKFRVKR